MPASASQVTKETLRVRAP